MVRNSPTLGGGAYPKYFEDERWKWMLLIIHQVSMRSSCFLGGNFKKNNLRIMGSQNWWFGDPRPLQKTHPNPSKIAGSTRDSQAHLFHWSKVGWGFICNGIFHMECEVGSLPNGIGTPNGWGSLSDYAWRIIPVSKWLVTPIYKPWMAHWEGVAQPDP